MYLLPELISNNLNHLSTQELVNIANCMKKTQSNYVTEQWKDRFNIWM